MPAPDVVTDATVGALLAIGTSRLRAAGFADAGRTAREFLAAIVGRDATRLWLDQEGHVKAGDVTDFRTRIDRAMSGEPIAYVRGLQEFRSLTLRVDRSVLIPRPETEGLVDLVLRWARERWGPTGWGVAADVGTGSGCVALSLALEGAFTRVIGTDLAANALELARANAADAAIDRCRLEWRQGSFLVPLEGEQLDVIVANPPYVTGTEWEALDSGVRDFEPRGALVSPEDGLAHTRQLLESAPTVLKPGGLVALEVDARRASSALRMVQRAPWHEPVVREDVFGRPRYLLAMRE